MALAGVEYETFVFEPDALTTRPLQISGILSVLEENRINKLTTANVKCQDLCLQPPYSKPNATRGKTSAMTFGKIQYFRLVTGKC